MEKMEKIVTYKVIKADTYWAVEKRTANVDQNGKKVGHRVIEYIGSFRTRQQARDHADRLFTNEMIWSSFSPV